MESSGATHDAGPPVLYRATLFHTPGNAFEVPQDQALEAFEDGAVAVAGGRIVALDDFGTLHSAYPGAAVADLRPGYLLPGLVDTHVHYPQVYSMGRMGLPLLQWLERYILPDEMRFEDQEFARGAAEDFLDALIRNGTTTALAFGVHVRAAQEALFAAALRRGFRLISGMVCSDRNLLPGMHSTPERSARESAALIGAWHGRGRLRYALTPRFAVSASGSLLAALGELLETWPDLYVQTHLNETADEVELVRQLFPDAPDYLAAYEAGGLLGRRSVFAHNIHPTTFELERLGESGAAVAHCPGSNEFLGSGLFPLRAHLEHGVRVGLGTDVAAGPGFNLIAEAKNAYQVQMLQPGGLRLSPAQLLYLATGAGAAALGLDGEIGDLSPGKAADMLLLCPAKGGQLNQTLRYRESPADALGALMSMAGEWTVARVYMSGREVYRRQEPS